MKDIPHIVLHLSLLDPNGAPEITSASVTTHTVTLSWTALPEDQWNGNLTGYAISSHSEGLVVEVPAHQLTITLEARPFTEYILSVAAVNSVGMGPFSDTTIVRTKEDGELVQHSTFTDPPVHCFQLQPTSQSIWKEVQ